MRGQGRRAMTGMCRLAGGERGFAVPTVMFMLLGVFAVVSIGVVASIQAQGGAVRDQKAKSALATAEAGISDAMLHYNGDFTPSTSQPCLVPSGTFVGAAATQGSGWCTAVSGSDGAGTFTYQVKPTPGTGTIEIVSSGNVNGVMRRVDVTAKSVSGQQVFFDAGVKTQNGINLDANAEIHSGSATGGDITLASNAKQCGVASVGVGHHLTTAGNAAYYQQTGCTTQLNPSSVTQQDITLPPVNQGDAATHNDNVRITNAVAADGPSPKDLISGNKSDVSWDSTTRQLTIEHNSSLTLTGQTYSFCKLTLNSNSALYVAAGQTVNIYFDSPEHCDVPPGTLPVDNPSHPEYGTTQMDLSSNTRITSATGTPAKVAIYFVGSQTRLTNLLMSSNTQIAGSCVQNFIIYAPLTHIELNSNSQYCGALAGQSLHMDSNAEVFTDTDSQAFVLPGTAPHYAVSQFVECTAASSSPPNNGC
jgi:hypothetical protein